MGRSGCSNIAKVVQLMARSSVAGAEVSVATAPGMVDGRREEQQAMAAAVQHVREAQRHLELASHNKGGHQERPIQLVNQAIAEVEQGIQYENTHWFEADCCRTLGKITVFVNYEKSI